MNLSIRVEIFKEDDMYVALSPELNVSSFGETIDEAKESIKEAIEAFLEECQEMGTLDGIWDKKIGLAPIHHPPSSLRSFTGFWQLETSHPIGKNTHF